MKYILLSSSVLSLLVVGYLFMIQASLFLMITAVLVSCGLVFLINAIWSSLNQQSYFGDLGLFLASVYASSIALVSYVFVSIVLAFINQAILAEILVFNLTYMPVILLTISIATVGLAILIMNGENCGLLAEQRSDYFYRFIKLSLKILSCYSVFSQVKKNHLYTIYSITSFISITVFFTYSLTSLLVLPNTMPVLTALAAFSLPAIIASSIALLLALIVIYNWPDLFLNLNYGSLFDMLKVELGFSDEESNDNGFSQTRLFMPVTVLLLFVAIGFCVAFIPLPFFAPLATSFASQIATVLSFSWLGFAIANAYNKYIFNRQLGSDVNYFDSKATLLLKGLGVISITCVGFVVASTFEIWAGVFAGGLSSFSGAHVLELFFLGLTNPWVILITCCLVFATSLIFFTRYSNADEDWHIQPIDSKNLDLSPIQQVYYTIGRECCSVLAQDSKDINTSLKTLYDNLENDLKALNKDAFVSFLYNQTSDSKQLFKQAYDADNDALKHAGLFFLAALNYVVGQDEIAKLKSNFTKYLMKNKDKVVFKDFVNANLFFLENSLDEKNFKLINH